MKIGLVGYYGFGNFGDEWMLETMRLLAPQIEFTPFYYRGDGLWKISNDVDAILIGGGNILIPLPAVSKSYFNPIFLEMGKPIIVWGVDFYLTGGYFYEGIEAINQFLIHPNVLGIWLRSPFDYSISQYLLRSEIIEKVYLCYDICYAYPVVPPTEWVKSAALIALGERLSNFWTCETTQRLEDILRGLGYSEVAYIVLGWDEIGRRDWKFTKEVTRNVLIWRPTSVEETLNIMKRYDMVVTCKLHGAIAAALLHKRIKILSQDNKFFTLCLAISGLSMDDFILQLDEGNWKVVDFEAGEYCRASASATSIAKETFYEALQILLCHQVDDDSSERSNQSKP